MVADDGMLPEETREIVFQFRPALPNAQKPDGTEISSLPDDLPYGIRVQIMASNVRTDEFLPLLQAVADRMDIRPAYFADAKLHE